MILPIANVLTPEEVALMAERLGTGRFQPGSVTAGWHAKLVKDNEQLRGDDPACSAANDLTPVDGQFDTTSHPPLRGVGRGVRHIHLSKNLPGYSARTFAQIGA